MTSEKNYIRYLNVCTHYYVEELAELSEIIEHIMDIEKPKDLKNIDIYYDESDLEEFELTFSSGSLEEPESNGKPSFKANVSTNSDDNEYALHLHSFMEVKDRSEIVDLHSDLFSRLDGIEVTNLNILFELNDEINQIFRGLDHELRGVTVAHEGNDFIFFQAKDDTIRGRFDYESSIEGEIDLAEFVEHNIDKVEEFLVNITT